MMPSDTPLIHDLPAPGLIPLALIVLIGLMLWGAGRRLLRPALAALGTLVGGILGWILAGILEAGETSLLVPPWAGAIALGLVCGLVGALVYRLAVAGALALVLAVASAGAVLMVEEHQRQAPPAEATAETIPEAIAPPESQGTIFDDASDWIPNDQSMHAAAAVTEIDPATEENIRQARDFAARLLERIQTWWEGIPAGRRPALVGATIAGGILGLLIGTLAPGLSTSFVTAFGGSLVWLTTLGLFLTRVGVPADTMPASPTVRLVIWCAISLTGVAIQWRLRPRPADSPG